MPTPSQQRQGIDHSKELTKAVEGEQWGTVLWLIHTDDCSSQQRHWAIDKIVKNASKRFLKDHVDEICDVCAEDKLGSVLSHLVTRRLWGCVGRMLQRDISDSQHRWAVVEASKDAADHQFVGYVFFHCKGEELESVLTIVVSRGMWMSVGDVLKRGVSSTQHRWAVEEGSKHASEDCFIHCILSQCNNLELDFVLTHLLSRGMWKSVGEVLERGVSPTQRSWAVKEALKHAGESTFIDYILPHCKEEELDQVAKHMVLWGLWDPIGNVANNDSVTQHILLQLMLDGQWSAVNRFLQRDISIEVHSWAVEEAFHYSDENHFTSYILPHCLEEELELVLAHMVSQGIWEPVDKNANNGVSVTQHILSQLMSRGQWSAFGRFLQRDIDSAVHRWAVEQASRLASDDKCVFCIIPHCSDDELESVVTHLVSRGLCWSLHKVLERGVISTRHRSVLVEAVEHADDVLYHGNLLPHCSEEDVFAIFPHLVADRKLRCARHVLVVIMRDTLYTWITIEHDSKAHDTLFWKFIHSCRVDVSNAFSLTKPVTQQLFHSCDCDLRTDICNEDYYFKPRYLSDLVSWQRLLCEALLTTLLCILCDVICRDDREYTDSAEHSKQCVSDVYTHIIACVQDNIHCVQDDTLTGIQNKEKWTSVFTELADIHSNDPLFLLHFLQGLNLYHTSRRGTYDDTIVLVILAVFPLFPQLQSAALRIMLREKRWDILSQACLSHVWEHDRRQLFKAAVMQRQWDVVRQWCDHTVHDDQRHWALTEAFKEKQWEVYLLLADHGLTVDEQMYAHYRVAKYGHWATVLNMVDRGGDITEVSNLLEKWVMRYLRKKPEGDVTVYEQRCMKLIRLRLRFAQKSVLSPRKALERCLWGTVLFNILHKPTQRFFSEVLDKVLEEQQWHVLMHLVRLGMTSADRNRLFPDMVRQQQWGVCRQLLEHGVDDQLCLEALPELMEKNQWMLVARVMEHDVDDAVRRQVLLMAFQKRAGTLFWHCLNLMEDQQYLSTAVKEQLFHQAIRREIWQAVKPLVKEKAVRHLVKEKDGPDIQRRDLAFLEAIDQHLWDVVDYCQRLGADINMKDENGETPLNREARKREWKAVEEIVLRDGYPNQLDMNGVSVMNRLIEHEQWDIVKVVIKYGGDIHLSANVQENYIDKTHTPLQALITARQADVIHSTIKWCGGQDWGVNDKGERVLHAVCDSDRWDVMRDLIDIKVNPLVLTNKGKSPLAYAVLNTKCGQRMVAECSRQGFSFHQPSLTGPQETLLQDICQAVLGPTKDMEYLPYVMRKLLFVDQIRWFTKITSPLVCAVLCDLPVEAFMLYESGSCSNTELFTLHTQLPKLADLHTEEGRALHEKVDREIQSTLVGDSFCNKEEEAKSILQRYNRVTHTLKQFTPFLRELATTPRPLLSSCRLKILQAPCFHFSHKYREKAMGYGYLRLPDSLKEYLKFSDFCDPDYVRHMT